MERKERLARMDKAMQELAGARSALAHGRYATYVRKLGVAIDQILPLLWEDKEGLEGILTAKGVVGGCVDRGAPARP